MNAAEQRIPALFNNLGEEPVHRAIRRLRWFKSSFLTQVEIISEETGIEFETNTEILAKCFIYWIQEFEANKPEESEAYEAYVGYASGLMLRALVNSKPLHHLSIPEPRDKKDPAQFWPEGYVYVNYCLNVRHLVLDRLFVSEADEEVFSDKISDIGVWWSFKENVDEHSSYAIPFLDVFAGDQANFSAPGAFNPAKTQNKAINLTPVSDAALLDEPDSSANAISYCLALQSDSVRVASVNDHGVLSNDKVILVDSGNPGELYECCRLALEELLKQTTEKTQTEHYPNKIELLITRPDALQPQADELKSNLQSTLESTSSTETSVIMISESTRCALTENLLGLGQSTPTFLVVVVSQSGATTQKLVYQGEIAEGSDSFGSQLTENENPKNWPNIENLPASIQFLHKLMGLRHVVICAPVAADSAMDAVYNRLSNELPDIDFSVSRLAQNPESLGSVCYHLSQHPGLPDR